MSFQTWCFYSEIYLICCWRNLVSGHGFLLKIGSPWNPRQELTSDLTTLQNKWPDYIAQLAQDRPVRLTRENRTTCAYLNIIIISIRYYICQPSFLYYAKWFCHLETYKVLTTWINNCIMGFGTICDCVKSYWPSSSGHMREGPIMFTDLVPK